MTSNKIYGCPHALEGRIDQVELAQHDLTEQVTITKNRLSENWVESGLFNAFRGKWKDSAGNVIQVAVKVIKVRHGQTSDKESPIEEFLKETLHWKSVNSKYTSPLFGFIRSPVLALISMWYDNGTVIDYLRKKPNANRYHLFLDVVRAVEYVHRKNLIHGDINGTNILVTHDGRAVLCDFGSSKFQEILLVRGFPPENNAVNTTEAFRSPELYTDFEATLTTASDVWAVGCVAIEIVVGIQPWEHCRNGVYQYAEKAIRGEYPLSDDKTPVVGSYEGQFWEHIKKHCWKLEPKERSNAETLLYRTLILIERRLDVYAMGKHLTSVCIASGTQIPDILLEREFGLRLDDLCWEVVQAVSKRNKTILSWENYTLLIKNKLNDSKELRRGTDQPFRIFQKEDFELEPRFSFRYIKQEERSKLSSHFGATVDDSYDQVINSVLQAYNIEGDKSQYVLLIICSDGEEKCLSLGMKPMVRFNQYAEAGRSPRFSFRRIIKFPSPMISARLSLAGKDVRDWTLSRILDEKLYSGPPNEGTGIFAIAIITWAPRDILIDSCFKMAVEKGQPANLWLRLTTRAMIAAPKTKPEALDTASFLLLKVHPLEAIRNTRQSSVLTQRPQSHFPSYSPISLEYLSDLEEEHLYIAIADHRPMGDYEVSLNNGDRLRVFRNAGHWRFVIKSTDGERGWVPCWKLEYVGDSQQDLSATSASAHPATKESKRNSARLLALGMACFLKSNDSS